MTGPQELRGFIEGGSDGFTQAMGDGTRVGYDVPAHEVGELRPLLGLRDCARAVLHADRAAAQEIPGGGLRGELNDRYEAHVSVYGPVTAWTARGRRACRRRAVSAATRMRRWCTRWSALTRQPGLCPSRRCSLNGWPGRTPESNSDRTRRHETCGPAPAARLSSHASGRDGCPAGPRVLKAPGPRSANHQVRRSGLLVQSSSELGPGWTLALATPSASNLWAVRLGHGGERGVGLDNPGLPRLPPCFDHAVAPVGHVCLPRDWA